MRGLQSFSRMAPKLLPYRVQMEADMYLPGNSDIISIKPLPALTGLKVKGNFFSAWAGVRTDCKVTLWIDGTETASETGEIQLTDYGISGIPVFQISGMAARAWKRNAKYPLR